MDTVWKQRLGMTRDVWLWPAIIIVSALVVVLFSISGVDSPLRAVVAFGFVLICPGMAVVRFLRIEDRTNEIILAVAASMGIGTILSTIMVVTRQWSPEWGLGILVYISVVGALLQVATNRSIMRLGTPAIVRTAVVNARIRLYFGLITAALLLVTLSGGVLVGHGSILFFQTLDSQTLTVSPPSLSHLPFQALMILASRFLDNPGLLQVVVGLGYALIPLAALALSWWIVRDRAKPLFVWAALAVGIGMLPGIFLLHSEITLTLLLFCPLLMIILTRIRIYHVPLLILLPLTMIVTHLFSVLLILMAFGAMLLIGFVDKSVRLRMWLWAGGLLFMGVFAAWWFTYTVPSGEFVSSLTDALLTDLPQRLSGYPLIATIIGWVAGISILLRPQRTEIEGGMLAYILMFCEFIGIATAGVLLFIWATDPPNWTSPSTYSYGILFGSIPFLALAVLEALKTQPDLPSRTRNLWNNRSLIVLAAGVIFLLTLAAQSTGWITITRRFEQTVSQSQTVCIPAASTAWPDNPPVNLSANTAYSLLLQGRSPENVVLPGELCSTEDFTTGFPLTENGPRAWDAGWFEMRRLKIRLLAEQAQQRTTDPDE